MSQTGNSGSETEREIPLPHAAKHRRGMYSVAGHRFHQLKPSHPVRGPDHGDKDKGIDLAASVSSLSLEALPSTGPLAALSTVILGAWSAMRKASAPFIVSNEAAKTSLEF